MFAARFGSVLNGTVQSCGVDTFRAMLSYTTVNFPQLSLPAPLLVVLGGVLPGRCW